ncbi:MAG: peptide chain release factor N(5)-glutamine methyltransferase [Dehalococcoidia bacterium]
MKSLNFRDLYNFITNHLHDHKIDDYQIEASILLKFFIKEKKIKENLDISYPDQLFLLGLIRKRSLGFPLQYITQNVNFYKSHFYVNKNVLIPRPETEILIEECLNFIKKNNIQNPKIIDIGTGSGAIAISIAKEIPSSRIFAVDVSKKALEVAKINAKNHDVKINFIEGNLFGDIDSNFDVVISNPPYIMSENIKNLQKEVLYEPVLALDGGKDGVNVISKIIRQSLKKIKRDNPSGIFIEIDPQILKPLEKILFELCKDFDVNIKNDYSGLARILSIII